MNWLFASRGVPDAAIRTRHFSNGTAARHFAKFEMFIAYNGYARANRMLA